MSKLVAVLAMALVGCVSDAAAPPDAGTIALVDCGVRPEAPWIAPPTMSTFDSIPIVLVFAKDWAKSMTYQDALLVWGKCQAHNASLYGVS